MQQHYMWHASVINTICFLELTCMLPSSHLHSDKNVRYNIVHASNNHKFMFQSATIWLHRRTKLWYCLGKNVIELWIIVLEACLLYDENNQTSMEWKGKHRVQWMKSCVIIWIPPLECWEHIVEGKWLHEVCCENHKGVGRSSNTINGSGPI